MKTTKLLGSLLLLFGVLYVVIGLSRISFNVDILRLLPAQVRQVKGLSLFLKNFSFPNELIITLDAPDPALAKTSTETLAKFLRQQSQLVKNVVSQPPWEDDPDSLSEFITFLLLNQSGEKTAALQERLSPTHAPLALQQTMESLETSVSPEEIARLSYDPYGVASDLADTFSGALGGMGSQESGFSSADGKFHVLYVEPLHPFANYKQTADWLKQMKVLCLNLPLASGVKLGFTGEPAFVAEISTGMQWDMISSGLFTLLIISLIFWFCYGEFTPLFCLLILLQLIFLLSLATAGFLLNQLTAIGAGFASVMIGLSVDYGYFIYQRSRHHSGTLRDLQWNCLQNILWTSSTTAVAFFALNLSSLPGLSQLGTMVGMGVCIGAVVMIGLFAPLAKRFAPPSRKSKTSRLEEIFATQRFAGIGECAALALVLLLLGGLLFKGFPKADFSISSLRPRESASQSALDYLVSRLHDDPGELNLVVSGKTENEVLGRLRTTQAKLLKDQREGVVQSFLSPLSLWPDAVREEENISSLAPLAHELPRLQQTLRENGFKDSAGTLTTTVLQRIQSLQHQPLPFWPANETSRWILRRVARHQNGNYLALGVVEPTPGHERELADAFRDEGIYLVSWNQLGEELGRTMPSEVLHIAVGLLTGILLILAIGLRDLRALLLFTLTTALVFGCLAGAMSLLGMKWGFFNLAAILLLLGTGTDYSILLLLALKRNGGDVPGARRELGLVIFLCASSAAAGFGSLAWAGNLGLASLGQTCALGLLIDGIISLFLLPRAWSFLRKTSSSL